MTESFPLFKEAHDDRLFKHITFLEDNPDAVYRLVGVDHNNERLTVQTSRLKEVLTNIAVTDISKERFRIKAVLSEEDQGIKESHWVTQQQLDGTSAKSLNQYRIRGIATEGWQSDWVYSELRDMDNDLIVYNMIYDVLDLMLSVQDDHIEYLMDYIVGDTFQQILKDHAHYAKTFELEEGQTASMSEILSILNTRSAMNPQEELLTQLGEEFMVLAGQLKQSFQEKLMASPEEFTQLLRIYKLMDQYQERKMDFFQLLIENFIEDSYEKIVQNTNIEVLLQNEEEMGIYLTSSYEFDIKTELIAAIYDVAPTDHFVTSINDAVQLISEPVIYEELMYGSTEDVYALLRMALQEIVFPLKVIDQHTLLVESELEDRREEVTRGSIVEFDEIKEDYLIRNLLLFDVIESVIKTDWEPTRDFDEYFIDYMLKSMNDSRMKLNIDYNLEEVLEVLLDMGESFRLTYKKEFGIVNETAIVGTDESVQQDNTITPASLKERYQVALQELQTIHDKVKRQRVQEPVSVSFMDSMVSQYKAFKQEFQENFTSSIEDSVFHDAVSHLQAVREEIGSGITEVSKKEFISEDSLFREWQQAGIEEGHRHTSITGSNRLIDQLQAQSEFTYYNLFKHHLRHPNKFPIIEKKSIELTHDLQDDFIMDGTETLLYALGDMDGISPIGTFRLGVNTLIGEESS